MSIAPMRLLLLDDSKWFGEAFQYCLTDFDDLVYLGWFTRGSTGLLACQQLKPDIILLDPDPDNREDVKLVEALLMIKPPVKLVGFSMAAPGKIVPMLAERGAAGFISKYSSLQTIIREIRRISAGGWFR